MKTFIALAILALIATAALLGSPWMNQRFHMPAEKTMPNNAKRPGPPGSRPFREASDA
ncbi:hypothetical protein IR012_22550 [Pseudomonas putida]|uniref:hypothetical protein n=1 Tax=Pseudomonas putida TaxID=303 RepID=UPI0018A97DC9|nr:hypothetical protein [Pseudomonas putida]MBF8670595.1 hypothetical protein [Pseudomonas putida]MBF8715093.1 hypothetical protein [Pseudomonas putida]